MELRPSKILAAGGRGADNELKTIKRNHDYIYKSLKFKLFPREFNHSL